MVGDDAQGDIVLLIAAVHSAGKRSRTVENSASGIDLVDVVDALKERRHALEAHARVDVLRRELTEDRVVLLRGARAAGKLHEDEIPDLEVAILVDDWAAIATELGTAVVIDLRARPARPWDAHRPEVVGHATALDAIERHAYLLVPDVDRLIVIEVHRRPESILGKAVATIGHRLRQELPSERNRLFLEVVTEREIPGHLEEGGVPRGLADLLDVEGAHDLLDARGTRVRRGRLAKEVRLERHHAGVDKEQRGIVKEERRGRHDLMPAIGEVPEEPATNLCGLHYLPPVFRGHVAVVELAAPVAAFAWPRRPRTVVTVAAAEPARSCATATTPRSRASAAIRAPFRYT